MKNINQLQKGQIDQNEFVKISIQGMCHFITDDRQKDIMNYEKSVLIFINETLYFLNLVQNLK